MQCAKIASSIVIVMCLVAMTWAGRSALANPPPTSDAEKAIWNLEHSYWQFVEANDLSSYRNLWHADFLGWPSVSPAPVRKEHITDWITSQTSAGRSFKVIDFKPAAIQSSSATVTATYWTKYKWIDKAGRGEERTVRVIHTWIKNGEGWQIISGMSMPETSAAQK